MKRDDLDFIGFRFNGIHSSDLNIVRVSDGSRYNEDLTPAFQDKTAQKVGSDGTLYWESFYTNKPFPISFAFDSLTEAQFRRLRQVFNGKDIGELIFDESPYKKYSVKLASPAQIKYICFNEEDESTYGSHRVYKGEGTVQFVAYKPFARSVYKFLEAYDSSIYTNIEEWKEASGMAESSKFEAESSIYPSGRYYDADDSIINLYNPGDLDSDWTLRVPLNSLDSLSISLKENGTTLPYSTLTLENITAMSGDSYLLLNSHTNLIEGLDSNLIKTGNLYNKAMTSGDFFKIPVFTSTTDELTFNCNVASHLEYDYIYY